METVIIYSLVINSFPFVTLLLPILDVSAGPAEPPANPAMGEEVDPLSITSEDALIFIEDEELTIPITPARESASTRSVCSEYWHSCMLLMYL